MRKLIKTLTYGMMHVTVATTLTYLISGSWTVALSIGLLEPFVQTFFFYWHETMWEGKLKPAPVRSQVNPPLGLR